MALTTTFPWDEVSTFATEKYIPESFDQIYKDIPLINRLLARNKIADGSELRVPLEYAKGIAGNFDGQGQIIGTQNKRTHTYVTFNFKHYYSYADITLKDRTECTGDSQILSMAEARIKTAAKTLRDTLATDIYNDGTTDTGALTGLRLAVDSTGTYQGITRATYTWWAAGESAATSLTIANLLGGMATCKQESGLKPTIGITTFTQWQNFYMLFQPQFRFNEASIGDVAKTGFDFSLPFMGTPVVPDDKCTSGYFYWLNEDRMWLMYSPQNNFASTGWQRPTHQPGTSYNFITHSVELLITEPRAFYKYPSLT